MIKPNNFDTVQAFEGFTPIELGGHICVIKKVEETKSSTGKDMLKIYIDTDRSDKQPGYYEASYKNDKRDNKRWGCVVNTMVLDANGDTSRAFKTFIECVEKSNNGFKIQWGENFIKCLQGKLIGGVFGREEYLDSYGESKFLTKCRSFRSVSDIKAGVAIPKDKLLSPGNTSNYGFEQIAPGYDGDMPF